MFEDKIRHVILSLKDYNDNLKLGSKRECYKVRYMVHEFDPVVATFLLYPEKSLD